MRDDWAPAADALSQKTARANAAHVARWLRTCAQYGWAQEPTAANLRRFVTLLGTHHSAGTARGALNALRRWCRDAHPAALRATRDPGLKRVLEGLQRTKPVRQTTVRIDDVRAACAALGHRPMDRRDRALVLAVFVGLLTLHALQDLRWADVRPTDHGLVLTVRWPSARQIAVGPAREPAVCLGTALDAWRAAARAPSQALVFPSVDTRGQPTATPLTHNTINKAIRRAWSAAGLRGSFPSNGALRRAAIQLACRRVQMVPLAAYLGFRRASSLHYYTGVTTLIVRQTPARASFGRFHREPHADA